MRVPPCTVRFRLPEGTNPNRTDLLDNIREDIFHQLLSFNKDIATTAEIQFTGPLGPKAGRFVGMDVTVASPAQFRELDNLTLFLGEYQLEISDKGPPVPANILTVSIKHLPAQVDKKGMARALYDALNKYRPNEIEVWDVYAKHAVYASMPTNPKFCGAIFAAVHFINSPATQFPGDYVEEVFPGFVKIRHQVYTLEYAERIDHCWVCKDRASVPHLEAVCVFRKCWDCGQTGHTRAQCPGHLQPYQEQGNDNSEDEDLNDNNRKRSREI
jgi:hypothetical protein